MKAQPESQCTIWDTLVRFVCKSGSLYCIGCRFLCDLILCHIGLKLSLFYWKIEADYIWVFVLDFHYLFQEKHFMFLSLGYLTKVVFVQLLDWTFDWKYMVNSTYLSCYFECSSNHCNSPPQKAQIYYRNLAMFVSKLLTHFNWCSTYGFFVYNFLR